MFFERLCPGCGAPARTVCDACWSSLGAPQPMTLVGLESVATVAEYDELVGRLVVAAKNTGRRDVLRRLAGEVADLAATELSRDKPLGGASPNDGSPVDAVTWVPASPAQRRDRGFDQGRIVAGVVAARLGVPARRLLRRSGRAQRGGDRSERLVGPTLVAPRPVPPRVVLIDDVITTGSSIRRAGAELHLAGATRVDGFAFASVKARA